MSGTNSAHSVVEPTPLARRVSGLLVAAYALVTMIPLLWIFATGFKTPPDSISYPPKVVFEPSLEGYVNVFTTRSRQTPEYMQSLPPPQTWYDELVRSRNMVITGPSRFADRYFNSVVIGFGSTFLAVFLGTLAAYAFSRFRIPASDDLLFFILSTRMMPPIAVAIPIFLMFRELGLSDTYTGMILLYTAVNMSLSVWLLKGFMDEIPREYEEAAMVFYRRHLCRLDPWPDFVNRSFELANLELYGALWGNTEFNATGLLKDYDASSRLARIEAPTLYTCGEFDESTPAACTRFAELTPNAEVRLIPGASHMAFAESPALYMSILREFFARAA